MQVLLRSISLQYALKFAFLRTRQVRWDLSSRLVNGKKDHDCFLPFNPIIIITCGVHLEKHGLPYLSLKTWLAPTLTIASILSNGGTYVNAFFFALKKINNIFFFFFSSSSLGLIFAIFKLWRNSPNKSHANIKCFTVFYQISARD